MLHTLPQQRHWFTVFLAGIMLALSAVVASAASSRTGSFIDEVIVSEEPNQAAAITRLEVGEIDVYAFAVSDAALYQRVGNSKALAYTTSYGSNTELTFNPVGPEFKNGKLNPFSVPRIREALNWLIDRKHIAQEIYGGMAVPKFFPITSAFPDYARMAETVRRLELKYAYNPEQGKAVINEEMRKLGATMVNGKWHYKGAPVVIIVLIRTEDERKTLGDYVATVLEGVGFTTDRQYKTAAEASPIWYGGDPAEGGFHIYTGGWVTTAVQRDQGGNFNYYYTPRGLQTPLWQAYKPAKEFDEVADRLDRNDYKTVQERNTLLARALELSMQDSVRLWIVDRLSFTPTRANVKVAADLAGGVAGAQLWPFTLRFDGREGGTMRVAMPSILTEPWNPIAGTNWIYDQMLIRGTADRGVAADPFTGLFHPQRISRADVFVKQGLPVARSLDWVNLQFVPENKVPADAWIDWDPVAQRFITVGEKHPGGLTANVKSVVYYPADLYSKVKWHDGSSFSVADIVMGMILTFDRGKPQSRIFDESAVAPLEAYQRSFRGMRIVSENPLIIEHYTDTFYLDAEWSPATYWPIYTFGEAPWHTLALGIAAEAAGESAFSKAKAQKQNTEWLNMVAGETVSVLAKHLRQSAQQNSIPYAPTLGKYVSSDAARARWNNLSNWYNTKGHFWVSSGALYLERAYPVEGTVHLKRNTSHPDSVEKWARFAAPMIAEVDIEGPARARVGTAATFSVFVEYGGKPYPREQIDQVKYLVVDAKGAVAATGDATFASNGEWRITLSGDLIRRLGVGTHKLEAIVVSKAVSIPTFESAVFVVTP